MKERKQIRKWFWAWDDQKEEVWLQKMAQEGWTLEEYRWFKYTFRASEPSKLVYRLDHQMGFPDRSYFDLFEMDGWDRVCSFNGWHYFCKEDDGTDKLEIFTDNQSRATKYIQLSNYIIFILLMQILSFWLPIMTGIIKMPLWAGGAIASVSLIAVYGAYMLKRKAKNLKEFQI
ncbi:DUF2812 domain-containing protein [Terribacillus saccharophilus]|uniref:DUF2812 domain-containing protein n=1 Tax=Terribacillus saccharophilus TaxID=361277 RepID=UPI00398223E8